MMPTQKGTIRYVGKKKYICVKSKKTGKNCYTVEWKEIPKKK